MQTAQEMQNQQQHRLETLGPAERTIQTLLTFSDHMVHNRSGVVVADATSPTGVRWYPATYEGDVVFRLDRAGPMGRKTVKTRLGRLTAEKTVVANGRVIGEYRLPGLYPEVASWLYRQVADVWRLDNEFAARWASWSFAQEHRDLKVILAAMMLVQPRCGEPIRENGEVLFLDEDYRDVGLAMCLLRRRDGRDLNPRLLLRVGELLTLPGVAAINRELGFGRSARNPAMGRYPKAVTKWLRHREQNVVMLEGLVKAGFRRTVMKLARKVGYKPQSERFFEVLRWRQKQAVDGRRAIAIGQGFAAAESWKGLTEVQICTRIMAERPNYKRIVGLLSAEVGLTRAIMAAAVEAKCVSDAELIILTPTLEELGLLNVIGIKERWAHATERADNQRAAHIAQRVRRKETAEKLNEAADRALQKTMDEALRGLRVYCAVDISASMAGAIEKAKGYLNQFLQGFPMEKLTVSVFNTTAREVKIRHASARGVQHAFLGFRAGGGTSHGSAFREVFRRHRPAEDEDVICLFVGDQQQRGSFTDAVKESGLNPVAFGFLYVPGNMGNANRAVEQTADNLGIPCFRIEEGMFGDAYAVSRTLRHLIASTPVGKGAPKRQSLVSTILETPLLTKPVWA
jgi:hypothetical protein